MTGDWYGIALSSAFSGCALPLHASCFSLIIDASSIGMLQYILSICRSGGMADAPDSKSGDGDIVRVQVPPPAPNDPNLSGRRVRIFDWNRYNG